MSMWLLYTADNLFLSIGSAVFKPESNGDTGHVFIRSDNKDVRNFLIYYLDDPLDQHPVYIEGKGFQQGPHSRNIEQFDIAMNTLSHYYAGYQTQKYGPGRV